MKGSKGFTSATLTIRIDPTFKADVESAAAAADQTVTEYVVRALKLRMRGAAETVHVFEMRERETHVPFPFSTETLRAGGWGDPPFAPPGARARKKARR